MDTRIPDNKYYIDSMISHTAVCGHNDVSPYYDDPIDIYWNMIGQFMTVYIENMGNYDYCYILFYCMESDSFDRVTVQAADANDDMLRCLYKHVIYEDNKEELYFDEGLWYEKFISTLLAYSDF